MCFVSRPCRDAGPLVVSSRHCEDFVLLYRVMQGLVPIGTLADWLSYHGTARTLSSCTVLCKVASLSGRWLIGCLITALRGLRPLVPCYAKSRPCRDAGLSRHWEDFVLLYRVMQGLVPVGTLVYHGTTWTSSSCTVLCKVSSLTGRDSSMTADRACIPVISATLCGGDIIKRRGKRYWVYA